MSGVGPTLFGRNGGGDPFFTDGEIGFARLAPGCEAQEGAPVALAPPLQDRGEERRVLLAHRLWRRLL